MDPYGRRGGHARLHDINLTVSFSVLLVFNCLHDELSSIFLDLRSISQSDVSSCYDVDNM